MVVDLLKNWPIYFDGPIWKLAFDFLVSLNSSISEGKYDLQGEDVFARVMSYSTIQPENANLEAHREYVDIQTTLIGAEGIEWFPSGILSNSQPYLLSRDVEFYIRPERPCARIDVFPGTFVVFFPKDAHMPQLVVRTPELIKKVVVKVKLDLVRPTSMQCCHRSSAPPV